MDKNVFYHHLTKDLIPFWNGMIDETSGGFYGFADKDGVPDPSAAKGGVLTSRILWFYSSAYELLRDETLLPFATHAYQFIADKFYDREFGGIYWSVSADGAPKEDIKHTYNLAFAIYALSCYYRVSGEKAALQLVENLYGTIEKKCRDEDGYLESFARDFSPVSNDKLSENGVIAERTMNTLLHILEAYTELFRATGSDSVRKSIIEILDIFRTKVYNPEKKMCEVFFNLNYEPIIDLVSYGHDIEASWLIDRACSVLDDVDISEKMSPVTSGLAEGAYRNGIDRETGGMNFECEDGAVNRKKIWWIQAESVTGFYNAYQRDPSCGHYLDASEKVWEYIQDHVIDRASGEWFENVEADNTVDPEQPLAHQWKCPYHNGRMCIEMIRRMS
ncbi:MAG: AGE family epimerase/isomerase [Firmicutes bacterium]|nr:AGE family epimerase/isomerase [Bacillota bacterium]